MPLFMTLTKFTEEALAAMTQRPSNRPEAMTKVIEAHGGKVIDFYWTFGDADVITIYEAPSNQAAMAMVMSLSAGGAVSSHKTSTLISNDDAMAAMKMAGSVETGYTSPVAEWKGWRDEGGEA